MLESEDGDRDAVTPADARAALDSIDRARADVAGEVGLPRWYWWMLAAAWVVLGVLGDLASQSVTTVATIMFGLIHSTVASRRLSGRTRTNRLQVSAATAGHRLPIVVVAMLLVLVAITVAAGFALDADGVRHPGIVAALFVGAIVGLGGPEILQVARRWANA